VKVLVFDIWGDYGHFKRIYTSTSPLTYDFPPKTTIYGILGCFLGLGKEEYLKYLNKNTVKVALKIINPIKKTDIAINLINTKNDILKKESIKVNKSTYKISKVNLIKNRTQIRFELLKNPKYRLYVNISNDDLYLKLKKLLKEHKTIYTPSLGISEFIANFNYVGEYSLIDNNTNINNENNNFTTVNTLIRRDNIINDEINLNHEKEYLFSKIPNEINQDRITTEYVDIFYEKNGEPINCKIKEVYYINELKEYISFM